MFITLFLGVAETLFPMSTVLPSQNIPFFVFQRISQSKVSNPKAEASFKHLNLSEIYPATHLGLANSADFKFMTDCYDIFRMQINDPRHSPRPFVPASPPIPSSPFFCKRKPT